MIFLLNDLSFFKHFSTISTEELGEYAGLSEVSFSIFSITQNNTFAVLFQVYFNATLITRVNISTTSDCTMSVSLFCFNYFGYVT